MVHFFFNSGMENRILSQDMRENVFPNIPVWGRVIYPNVYRFFDHSGQAIIFSSFYSKIVQGCFMATFVLMQEYW